MLTVKDNFENILNKLTIGDHLFDPKQYGVNDPSCFCLNIRSTVDLLKIDYDQFLSIVKKGMRIEFNNGRQTTSEAETLLYFNSKSIKYLIFPSREYKYADNDYDYNLHIYTNFKFV